MAVTCCRTLHGKGLGGVGGGEGGDVGEGGGEGGDVGEGGGEGGGVVVGEGGDVGGNVGEGEGWVHTPSIAFRHLPPNSARFSYATEGALFISAQLSSDAVSALRKVRILI